MDKETKPTRLKNIDALVKSGGEVTIGRIGPVRCGATAADEDQSLAMLARRPEESLEELLDRLDRAIVKAWDEEEYVDEINR
jgi:ribosome assembly protein YihI (activator of Der GTPase)